MKMAQRVTSSKGSGKRSPSKTPDQLQVEPRWRKATHVFGVAHQAKVRLYVEPSLWTPQGAGLQEARMAVSRASAAGTQVPTCTHVLSLHLMASRA